MVPGVWMHPEHPTYQLNGEVHDCDCERQDDLRRHYLLAGIPQQYWTLDWSDWGNDSDPKALAAAREYLDQWKTWRRHGVGLQFYSPRQGTGKTMLACLIGKELIKRRVKVQFSSFLDAVHLFTKPYEELKAVEERFRNIPVLILDDIIPAISLAQRDLWAMQLESLVRFRTDGNAVTIVTSNMMPDEIDEHYQRIGSLLAAKQKFIHIEGGDFRRFHDWDLEREHLIKSGEARPIV